MKGIYHISSEGHNVIFRSEDDFIYFMNKLGIVTDALGMRLFAFCIMSTHMHAIAEADEAKLFAGSINNLYGRHLNANYGIGGHNMKFSFHALTGMEEIGTALEYVLRNPVHHNVASSAFEYPYSSIRIPYPEIFHAPKRYWNEDACAAKSILRASQIAGRDRRTIFGRCKL